MKSSARLFCVVLAASVASIASRAGLAEDAFEIVYFQSLTFPGRLYAPFMPPPEEGRPTTVSGILRLPAAEGGPVPAVILAHGCAGVSSADHNWARTFDRLGVATLVVNSFAGRDVQSVCRGGQEINMAGPMNDVYRALDMLAAHPGIDASRIALMGRSFGGRTALWASHARFAERYGSGSLRFAAHLALYPASCYIQLADEDRIGDAPIRIFHGAADEWTPVAPCRAYAARLRDLGKDAGLVEYAGAQHGFDEPALGARREFALAMNSSACTFVERGGKIIDAATGGPAGLNSPCVTHGAAIGHSPEARQQVLADVEAFLRAALRLK